MKKIKKKILKNEIILYLIAGGITTFVNWCTYAAMVSADTNLVVSNAVAWLIGVAVAFILNKNLVFKSNDEEWMKEFFLFTFTRLITGIIEIFGFPVLLLIPIMRTSIFSIEAGLAKIVMTIFITILNYLLGKAVFNKEIVKQKIEKIIKRNGEITK